MIQSYFKIAFLSLALLIGCSPRAEYYVVNQIKDGKYDSEYPIQPVSDFLAKITENTKLLSVLVFYENYSFAANSRLTKKDLTAGSIKSKALKKTYLNRPATGTATVIFYEKRKIALLTCAHIVNFPDTVYTYFQDKLGSDTEYVASVTCKTRQTNNVIDLPQVKDFEILALDEDLDLAIIGKELSINPSFPIQVFNYPIGKAEELEWGTHVYLIGFPRGKKMITSCIVSRPGSLNFLVDAAMPRGISGGIILAMRDGVPNFELVGMANAVSAETKYFLSPNRKLNPSEYDLHNPYDDKSFVKIQEEIYYGVTHAIAVESIVQFVNEHKARLKENGYDIDHLF
ncbi:serine protease [Calditrichota bacterium]